MNYKSFNLRDWIGHISGAIEDETTLDGNEMRDLVEFLSGLPRWIPVSERLPKIGDIVLCSVKAFDCEYADHHIIICRYCEEEFWKNGIIRAWQPLPEPYEPNMRGGE